MDAVRAYRFQLVEPSSLEIELTIDGETQTLRPGTVGIIPSNAVHSGKAITPCRIIDAFHPVREDYRL